MSSNKKEYLLEDLKQL